MEQHSIPRQITTFEFKLIGFMTLRQFIYLIIFFPLAYIVYIIFPIPLVNILLGVGVACIGVAFAFFPINDRPLDVWLKNLVKRLSSPTQYYYRKDNPPISIFQELYFVADPHRVVAHIESQQKLSAYLNARPATTSTSGSKSVGRGFFHLPSSVKAKQEKSVITQPGSTSSKTSSAQLVNNTQKKPFFIGTVKNNKKIALPGILIYVKNQSSTLRLLKTNPHGIFATYNPIPPGEYLFELKDPKGVYFFDTMKEMIHEENKEPIELTSKELL